MLWVLASGLSTKCKAVIMKEYAQEVTRVHSRTRQWLKRRAVTGICQKVVLGGSQGCGVQSSF